MSLQLDLLGNKKQLWSCCHCSWEGHLQDETDKTCPKCEWALWKIEEAKRMTSLYYAFKKKYGDENAVDERNDEY